ncbi:restriction endonuclease subunit S [Staphylococcus borealis]|uniref:restriction endonuclease subunit S n=1 Tax=Staphylococcus borealis TaxID=2742203 RepID=UPI00069CE3B4|nr:restriction endonuclease subunit S [Staphylococcus borealis]NUI79395.1 restriction endonuclease subunit S [Staphylococcus borealis]
MEYKISDLCDIRRGASPRPIKNYIVNSYDNSLPWVKIADATKDSSRYIYDTKERVSLEGSKKSVEVLPGDLILSNSATPGLPKFMKVKACIHDGWLLLRNFKNVRKEFLYYILLLNRQKLLQLSNGSVFNNLKTDIVKNYIVDIPSIKKQDKILKIIGNIEDKLDTNNKLIANLEKLSQTLFKHWFVDFEFPDKNGNPYKSSGGEMVDSELGEIPKGWRVETLEKLGSIVGGGTPSKKNKEYYTNNGIPWITPKDLSKNRNIYISHGENDISELGLNKSSAKLLEKNSVLFSSRAPIGYIAINNIPVTTNQGFKSIVPNEEMNPYFIYFILKNITPLIEQTASGSTFKEISAKGLKSIKIVFPSIELIEHYGNIVKKYFEEINFLENQNIKLIELRDTLLPKLMSGEIEIPDDIEVNNDELSI